jgi:hypothetical protein
MGKSRTQRRAEKGDHCISVYPPDTALGWRVIYYASKQRATEQLARGEWREVYDEHGNYWGCQVVANFKQDKDLPSRASSTAITASECELNAEGFAGSRTIRLTEEQKISRKTKFGKALPPEDAVERAIFKVAMWPFPASRIDDGTGKPAYGDRAVRCYPKPG